MNLENQILICLIAFSFLLSLLNFLSKLRSSFLLRVGMITQVIVSTGLIFILISRGIRLERFPWANFYESLLILGSLANLIYWISYIKLTKIRFLYFGKFYFLLFGLICMYAFLMPDNQKDPLPLVPSLRSYWIIIHVPLVIFSYVFFLFSGVFALYFLFLQRSRKQRIFFEFLVSFIQFGFFFLTLGLITGALWANQSWGSLWQWDPKENLALATWFAYLIILHLALNRKASQRRIALLSIFGFICFLITYLGINYLDLGGLHSYGKI